MTEHLHPEVMNPFRDGMRVMFKNIDVPRDHPSLRRGTVTDSHRTSVTVCWDAGQWTPAVAGSYHHSALIQVEDEPVAAIATIVEAEVSTSTTCRCGHPLMIHGPAVDGVPGSCGTFGCKCLHGEPA